MTLDFLKSRPGDDPVIVEAVFAASPERLFRAWTDPEEIPHWFGRTPHSVKTASIDLTENGEWRFDFESEEGAVNAVHGIYLRIDPNRELVFSWMHEMTGSDGNLEMTPASTVTVTFDPLATGTRLTIRHEGTASESGRRGVGDGWSCAVASLHARLESVDGTGRS